MPTFSKRVVLGFALFVCVGAQSASSTQTLETMKMHHRFGIGMVAGGALAVLGLSIDVNVTENMSFGLGMGTGLDYSTAMLQTRYFLLGEWVSPYVGVSLARWWTDGTTATAVAPGILTRFLGPSYDLSQGFSVFLLAPAVGVQFMHPMGFAISAELQYLFRLVDFNNGTYAGLSAHWYF